MAYNKAKAERQWFRWKEAEEKELRGHHPAPAYIRLGTVQ